MFDEIVAKQESRARDAKELQRIAVDHPDLFEAFAKSLLDTRGDNQGTQAAAQPKKDRRRGQSALNFQQIDAVLRQHENPRITLQEIAILSGLTRSAVRNVATVTHADKFESGPDPQRSQATLWSLAAIPSAGRRTASRNKGQNGKLPTTKALRVWFGRHKEGAPAGVIVSQLLNKISTKSKDPANIIHGSLSALERRGEVQADVRKGLKHFTATKTLKDE